MSDEKIPEVLGRIVSDLGGTVEEVGRLPDGSGFACVLMPLPKNHWLYADEEKRGEVSYDAPPMLLRLGTDDPRYPKFAKAARAAARYAYRACTERGKVEDIDPDALVQNFVTGLIGYYTPDGLTGTGDDWANPSPVPEKLP